MTPHSVKSCLHGKELKINSNYRYLLSSDEHMLMMMKIRKGPVSCRNRASTSVEINPYRGQS